MQEQNYQNSGIIKASTEEWNAIKSLVNHVGQPEIFDSCELEIMSGLEHEDWLSWNRKFSQDIYKDEPPKLIMRHELNVIFMTALNAKDAKVEGLTEGHQETIKEILKHSLDEAIECG